MAKNETPARVAVTATGLALLTLIKDAPEGFLELTEAEGAEIVTAGDAMVDPNQLTSDGLAAVRLTPQGQAKIAAATPQAAKAVKAQLKVSEGIDYDIPIPEAAERKHGRTGQSKFLFDELQVKGSFHVAATDESPDPLKSLQASLSLARAKYLVGKVDEAGEPVMETVTEKTYDKDADGKIKMDAEGHRIVLSTAQVQKQVMVPSRVFVAASVDASDPKGKGARVWRTA